MTDLTAEKSLPTGRFSAKREALITAASALFNEKGVIGTTLSEVGAKVGLIKNSVTYYYRRKEDLAMACFLRAVEAYDALIAQCSSEDTAEARVMKLIRLQVEMQSNILEGRQPPVVMFHEIRALPEPHSTEIFKAYTDMFRRLRDLLRTDETSHWSRDDLNARGHLLLSQTLNLKPLIGRYEPEDYPRLVERLISIVLHGVGAPDSVWTASGVEDEWLSRIPDRGLQAQFLRAATELINNQGYAGASINRIAEKLSLTKGGFYYYHENKDELVARCFEHSIGTIREAVNLTESYDGLAWEHLCAIVRGLVRFQLSEDGPLLRSTANSALPDPDHRDLVIQQLGRVTERIAGVVVSGLIDGSVRPVDPTMTAYVMLTGIAAGAELHRWVRSIDRVNVVPLYARPMLMGLLCAPEPVNQALVN